MYRRIAALKVAILTLAFVVGVFAANGQATAEPRQEDKVRQILLARNAELRAALLKAWLAPSDPRLRSRVDALSVDIFTSEIRLHALGVERKAVVAGVTVIEVPYFVFAERSGIDLDIWPIFAGRTFALPAGGVQR